VAAKGTNASKVARMRMRVKLGTLASGSLRKAGRSRTHQTRSTKTTKFRVALSRAKKALKAVAVAIKQGAASA